MSRADADPGDGPTGSGLETTAGEAIAGRDASPGDRDDGPTIDGLRSRVEQLSRENERLRREYVRARRSRYRRTAVGLFLVGAVAVAGAAAFPGVRTVLLALGGTGVFGAVLTYYLTPERVVSSTVGERLFSAQSANLTDVQTELGLQDEAVYVPLGGPGDSRVALFVPQHPEYELPARDALRSLFVVPGSETGRGVSLTPTGDALLSEFVDSLPERPDPLVDQLVDGLVQLELVSGAASTVDAGDGRAVVEVRSSTHGSVDRLDHPVASFLAAGLARGLNRPVTVEVVPSDDRFVEHLVTCEWSVDGTGDGADSATDGPDPGAAEPDRTTE